MNRRQFIQILLGLPVLGAAALFASPMFRYLKPTAGAFPEGMISKPDQPSRVRSIEFPLSDFPEPWSIQEFTYEQSNPEYTRQGAQISRIPGYLLRIPDEDGKKRFVAYSRICPHMGCIFRYVPDPHESETGFNYKPPKGTPMFGCPCHLSVYDPLQSGKVVSGPAPRGPRTFMFEEKDNKIVITNLEKGGIA